MRNEEEQLSEKEINLKIEEIIEEIEKTEDIEDIDKVYKLISRYNINTSKIAQAAYSHNIFEPIIYKDAEKDIRDALIAELRNKIVVTTRANRLLRCLAMIGDEEVVKAFAEFEKNSPKWRENLYVNPSIYAEEGGWTLDKDGNKQSLIFEECYTMVKDKSSQNKAVVIGKATNDKCPHCNSNYINILEIDGRDERMKFLGIDGIIKAKMCISCIPYDTIFCKYNINEESEIIKHQDGNYECIEDEDLNDIGKKAALVLSKHKVNKYYSKGYEFNKITIGGMANWVDDAIHLKCPCCKKKMIHLAQIEGESLGIYEGTIYFEICKECNIIGYMYQQT